MLSFLASSQKKTNNPQHYASFLLVDYPCYMDAQNATGIIFMI